MTSLKELHDQLFAALEAVEQGEAFRLVDAIAALKEMLPALGYKELSPNVDFKEKIIETLEELITDGGLLTTQKNILIEVKTAFENGGDNSVYDQISSLLNDASKDDADLDAIAQNADNLLKKLLDHKDATEMLEWSDAIAKKLVDKLDALLAKEVELDIDLVNTVKASTGYKGQKADSDSNDSDSDSDDTSTASSDDLLESLMDRADAAIDKFIGQNSNANAQQVRIMMDELAEVLSFSSLVAGSRALNTQIERVIEEFAEIAQMCRAEEYIERLEKLHSGEGAIDLHAELSALLDNFNGHSNGSTMRKQVEIDKADKLLKKANEVLENYEDMEVNPSQVEALKKLFEDIAEANMKLDAGELEEFKKKLGIDDEDDTSTDDDSTDDDSTDDDSTDDDSTDDDSTDDDSTDDDSTDGDSSDILTRLKEIEDLLKDLNVSDDVVADLLAKLTASQTQQNIEQFVANDELLDSGILDADNGFSAVKLNLYQEAEADLVLSDDVLEVDFEAYASESAMSIDVDDVI